MELVGTRLMVSRKKTHRVHNALGFMLSRPLCDRKAVEMVVGSLVWCALPRRECLSILGATYAFLETAKEAPIPW